jgi:hypothetical protein
MPGGLLEEAAKPISCKDLSPPLKADAINFGTIANAF